MKRERVVKNKKRGRQAALNEALNAMAEKVSDRKAAHEKAKEQSRTMMEQALKNAEHDNLNRAMAADDDDKLVPSQPMVARTPPTVTAKLAKHKKSAKKVVKKKQVAKPKKAPKKEKALTSTEKSQKLADLT